MKIKELLKSKFLLQFIKFGLVGVSNTVVSYVVYLIFVYFGMHYIIANFIGFVAGVLNSYVWNSRYVFKEEENAEKRSFWKTLAKTFASYGMTGLVLSSVLLYLWVDILGIPSSIAPIINLVATIPLNFILNKLWAYK